MCYTKWTLYDMYLNKLLNSIVLNLLNVLVAQSIFCNFNGYNITAVGWLKFFIYHSLPYFCFFVL